MYMVYGHFSVAMLPSDWRLNSLWVHLYIRLRRVNKKKWRKVKSFYWKIWKRDIISLNKALIDSVWLIRKIAAAIWKNYPISDLTQDASINRNSLLLFRLCNFLLLLLLLILPPSPPSLLFTRFHFVAIFFLAWAQRSRLFL